MSQQRKDIEQRLAGLSPEKRKLFEELLKREGRPVDGAPRTAIEHRPADGPSPLSFGQQRLWFIHQLEPESVAHNLPLVKRFTGPLDTAALQRALTEIVARHDVLRSRYVTVDGVPFQEVTPAAPFLLPIDDLSTLSPEARSQQSRRLVTATTTERFDLASGLPLRARLLKHAEDDHWLVLAVHHIVYDLWSGGVFWHELGALLPAFTAGEPSPLPPLSIQYRDFARWQRATLTDEALRSDLDYWKTQLAGAPSTIALPADHPRPPVLTGRAAMELLSIPPQTARQLRAVARAEQATMFMLLVAAFQTVLHWYSGSDDVVIGSPIANRKPAETEPLIGIFLNNLVLRGDLSGDPSFTQLLGRIRRTVLDAFAHTDVPFERLVEELQPRRALNVHPLFQVLFTLLSSTRRDAGAMASAPPSDAPASVSVAMDLEAYFDDNGESIGALFKYSTDLFDGATIARLCEQFRALLAAAADNPHARLSQLRTIAQTAEHAVREGWNDTRREFAGTRLLHQLVAEQAARTPEAAAAVFDGLDTSYAALMQRASQVAVALRRSGVARGARVGVYMDRSADLPAVLLGILQVGAAYVPLDPAFPADRIEYMLADSGAAALIVNVAAGAPRPAFAGPVVTAADIDAAAGAAPVSTAVSPEDVAYVIYTSGSTGRPKGVQVPHRAVVNFLHSMREVPGLAAADRLLAVTTLSFDIAGLELFLPLTTGATVVIASREDAADPKRLIALLTRSRATVMQATPATWRMLIEAGWRGSDLKVLCGGEALPIDLASPLCDRAAEVWNLYGPTETTIWSTVERVIRDRAATIGRPIANTRMHVVDRQMQPAPIGAAGEICIGGTGVARGYLDRPELTADRFVPDPSGESGARMYRTGDLGRFLADGRLEYLGRIDHQVKLRGFRIELGEIEAVLSSHPDVTQAVARVREDTPGDARLVAYLVAAAPREPLIEGLTALLVEKLPQYMHPSAFVLMAALPLTPNGKVDRAALPAPERPASTASLAPRTDLEERVAAVWRDVLRLDRVGVQDSFFDLGGHSLLLVQVQSRLSSVLDRDVSILELFQYPTIAALAAHLGGAVDSDDGGLARDAADRAARRGGADLGAAIAIVGMAGRFPGSPDIDAFWRNLRDGVEGIRFFSDEELRAAGVTDAALAQPGYVKARGSLDGADLFDAALFGFTPREADLMDPQQRIFLECAWEALERSGCDPQRYPGLIGVFAGASLSSYFLSALAAGANTGGGDVDLLLNGDKDHLPTRVSYKLNLRGPSLNIQTACSTSLVAVHVACRSLLAHECDMALAGGVSIGVSQVGGYQFVDGGILSPDGHCRAFDAKSGGTVGGNGAGIVVLKRLAEAIADGDHVHAVIRGTAINNDGSSKVGYTAPSITGEARAIALAQAVAGISGDSLGYVEAHGTGTKLGDPIEIKALNDVFRESTAARQYCALGSVKSNIGHLDAAAGVAGLIKTALVVEHGEIPPSLHFETANPEIDFESSPFFVNTALRRWDPPAGAPRRAAVSSFGLGGTNAHALLEEAPPREPSGPSREWQVLPIAARTEAALDALSERLAAHLDTNPDAPLSDTAFTLALGRQQLEHRRVVIARSPADAADALRRRPASRAATAVRRQGRVAFLFPGQGAQYARMGAELYQREPRYREAFDACAALFQRAAGFDLKTLLCDPSAPDDALSGTVSTQAALFAVEYALASLWMSWGVQPTAMIGHSIGEYVAAVLSGALSLEDGIALVAKRAALMAAAPAGAMLAVPLSVERIESFVSGAVSIAAVNGPQQCVLSGPRAALEPVAAALASEGVEVRWLQTAGAFHSSLMDDAVAPLSAFASSIRTQRTAIPYLSNVTGTWISEADVADPSYWARHMRGTVRFFEGMSALLESEYDVLLEVGPGQTLTSLARSSGRAANAPLFAASLPRSGSGPSELEHLALTAGRLWTVGAALDWSAYFAAERRHRVVLPTYPFERRRHWFTAASGARRAMIRVKNPDLSKWFFTPEWQSLPAARFAAASVAGAGPWLIFGGGDADAPVRAALRDARADAIVVEAGESFAPTAAGYRVNPARVDDFVALLTALRDARRLPSAVLHTWAVGGVDREWLVERAFGSVMRFVRAAGTVGIDVPRLFCTITSGVHRVRGDETLTPGAATSLGPALVLPVEHQGVTARTIDVAAVEWSRAGAPHAKALLAAAIDPATPAVAAFRGGRIWARSFHPQKLDAAPPAVLPSRGVFLITGGYGGVGLQLGRYLADTCGARLALTGREGLPDRAAWPQLLDGDDARLKQRLAAVAALEQAGAEVIALAADVTDPDAMQRAVAATLERFGRIDGVIHAAGVPGARVMQLDDGEESAGVLAPKVLGTDVLLRAIAPARPAFVILCSSISTTSGAIGQSAYTAANAYLDCVAQAAGHDGPRMIAINWDAWQEVGMAVDTAVPERLAKIRREELKHGILNAEGREAFARILSHDAGPQVIVSTRDPRPAVVDDGPVAADPRQESAPAVGEGHERPQMGRPFVAPRNAIEEEVADVWRQLFGLAAVGVDDDFFELGGHSLLATQVMSRVRARFQVDIAIGALFEEPTVAGLSMRVMEQLLAADADALGTSA